MRGVDRDNLVVAVLPSAAPADTILGPLAFALADFLTTDLARSRRLVVVERMRLALLQDEIARAQTVRFDPSTAPRAGRLLRARQLVYTSLEHASRNDIVFSARIVATESGRIDSTVVGRTSLADILASEKTVALALFSRLGVNLTPEERALVAQSPTRNLGALIAFGRAAQAELQGQHAIARREFQRAAQLDPGFVMAAERARSRPAPPPPITTAIANAVGRINRPLETIPTAPPRGTATDPVLPLPIATVIITVVRP